MKKLNPYKLHVEYRDGIRQDGPLYGRYYTLTHSDQTGDLFLTIAPTFASDKIDAQMRDEVLGQWTLHHGSPVFAASVYPGGPYPKEMIQKRYTIFVKELPLALQALRYGDRLLFDMYPQLNEAPVWVYFDSTLPEYRGWLSFGKMSSYA